MSFPNIPDVNPDISLTREEVINLIIASIALEELGLAHLINAEAEKIQAVSGTLPNSNITATSILDLIAIDDSVNKTMKTVIKNEMLLQFKLEDIFKLIKLIPNIFKNTATVEGEFNGVVYSDSDVAYYTTGSSPDNNNALNVSKKGVN